MYSASSSSLCIILQPFGNSFNICACKFPATLISAGRQRPKPRASTRVMNDVIILTSQRIERLSNTEHTQTHTYTHTHTRTQGTINGDRRGGDCSWQQSIAELLPLTKKPSSTGHRHHFCPIRISETDRLHSIQLYRPSVRADARPVKSI